MRQVATTSDFFVVGFFCSAGVPTGVLEDDEPTANLKNGFAVATALPEL